MPPDLPLSSTLVASNYPCVEHFFMVPKVFEPLKCDCIRPDLLFDDPLVSMVDLCCHLLISFAYFNILMVVYIFCHDVNCGL